MSSLRFVARLGSLLKAQMMMFPGMQLQPSKKNPAVKRWQQTVEEAPAPKAPQAPAPSPAASPAPRPETTAGGEPVEFQAVRRALRRMGGATKRWDALRHAGDGVQAGERGAEALAKD